MDEELRSRSLPETLELAIRAAGRAGVTRVSDVTAFAVPGVRVFQATRPAARSLTVSQGKGLTAATAIVGALLEASELWTGENLRNPGTRRPLAELGKSDIATWSGPRDALAIDLDLTLPRAWLQGEDLISGRACAMPWDLLSLDCTGDLFEYPATSFGLACGNNRVEALVSGLGEVLEQHGSALFDRLAPHQKLAGQIDLATIDDPAIAHLLRRIGAAGFQVKAWSLAHEAGIAAIRCGLFRSGLCLDDIAPAGGSGCHASSRIAFLRALFEAVQTRAGLVAGARDDLAPEDYGSGGKREAAVVFASLAFGDGRLDWRDIPTLECRTSEQCLAFLLARVKDQSRVPVAAFDHEPPWPGLHVVHVIAPGLLDGSRRRRLARPVRHGAGGEAVAGSAAESPQRASVKPRVAAELHGDASARKLLFAGPSIAGLPIPEGIEVRPPARCGDFAALLDRPPRAVALIDGYFKIAPTVWHKEIMSLLALGTRVIGGASLGALRAAELERFGMEGVGAIFHGYRSGALVRDDAVMLVHAPAELAYAPLSLPLVDAEHVLSQADLPTRARRTMQRIVRRAPFETRNWRDCLAEYRTRTGEVFPLPAEALEVAPSLKKMDARLVIEALAADAVPGSAMVHEMPPLTSQYRALLARTAPAFAGGPV